MKSGVRISSGTLKGVRLKVPEGVRPTSQMVREALFSRWQGRLPGARFLDLFAGSGAVGFEAVSRGASEVVWVEGSRSVERDLVAARRRLDLSATSVRCVSLPEGGSKLEVDAGFELIFADPPYDFDRWLELLSLVADWLTPGGEAALEHSTRIELPSRSEGLEAGSRRRYGDSCLSFYRHA